MRYYLDTEFIEDGKTIDLISIGIVREDGAEFYAQNLECDFSKANDWVKQNVLPSLTNFDLATLHPVINAEKEGGYGDWYSRGSIASKLSAQMASVYYGMQLQFIRMPDDQVEFWGYYSAYDHVALCQLFGTMMDLPKGWPMYTRDLKQWCDALGNPRLPEQGKGEHNSLLDARWNKQVYDFLYGKMMQQKGLGY